MALVQTHRPRPEDVLVCPALCEGCISHPSALFLQVDNWNPLTDTVPIHSWIHPWLPLMQARLEPLYSPVRSKLSSALQKWHPSDASAKLILQPWKEVLTPGSWEAFMLRNIVPKLGKETGRGGQVRLGSYHRGVLLRAEVRQEWRQGRLLFPYCHDDLGLSSWFS